MFEFRVLAPLFPSSLSRSNIRCIRNACAKKKNEEKKKLVHPVATSLVTRAGPAHGCIFDDPLIMRKKGVE